MPRVVLFYKRLIKPGGAERLALREYEAFKAMGYRVGIACFEFNRQHPFFSDVDSNDVWVVKGNNLFSRIVGLRNIIQKHSKAKFICNSGHVDYYLANFMLPIKYFLHIHQPSFMSINEKDKFSIFMSKPFQKLINTNYGAARFVKLKNEINFFQALFINFRAIISMATIRKAENVFVLSDYAVREKKMMYGIQATNISGALNKSIFQYEPEKLDQFNLYKNKLLTVARLDDKDKRIDRLITAFSIFLKKEPNSVLIIGGSGNEYQNLLDLTIDLGIEEKVEFAGFIPDEQLYDYYACADLFISIDWTEFRITSYEAMAMGTKVLLSDETDAVPELVDTGYYHLVKPEVQDVLKGIENALLAETVSKSQLFKVLKKYTWEEYFSKMEKIINA